MSWLRAILTRSLYMRWGFCMNETSLALSRPKTCKRPLLRVCNHASRAKFPKIHLNQQTSQTQAAPIQSSSVCVLIQIQCSDYTQALQQCWVRGPGRSHTERELKSLYTHIKSCTDMFSAADWDERLLCYCWTRCNDTVV